MILTPFMHSYASKNFGRFLKSSVSQDVREMWLDYIKTDLGMREAIAQY